MQQENEKSSTILNNFDQKVLDLSIHEDEIKSKWKVFLARCSYKFQKANNKRLDFAYAYPLVGYSIRRILYAIITLFLSISVLFLLVRLITPDSTFVADLPINKMGIKVNTPEYYSLIDSRMKMFGLYGSIWAQLGRYLVNIIPFIPKNVILDPIISQDGSIVGETTRVWLYLGVVFSSAVGEQGSQVTTLFAKAIPYSFAFGVIAILISYVIGIPLGILAAKRKEKAPDSIINGTSIFISSVPPIVLVIAIYYLSIYEFGSHSTFTSGGLSAKIWPIVVIVLMQTPYIVIGTRRYVIDEMTSDYAKFALSKGMSESKVFFVHIFRNAGIRIIRTFPIAIMATLFGSSIFTESYWGIPGMSKFIVAGIANRDTFVILGYTVFSAVVGILTSLTADLLMSALDPRIKLTK